jgi:hypothetical protein
MKTSFFLSLALCIACAGQPDYEKEKSAIATLIDQETHYAAAADSSNWKKCWTNTDEAMFTITSAAGAQQFRGWHNIEAALKGGEPFELKLQRDNYQYMIGNDVAFVSFDQQDNWGGTENKNKESRTLRKIGGEWKIVNVNVIGVSSFDKVQSASYHAAKENVPVGMKAPKTILRSQSGLGGMTAAYNELPAGSDMSPLFEGLPGNSCTAPHWGYLLEGSIRIKYVNGKEELVKAGEIFYWPAGHIPFVEKDVKLIDFSPEDELNEVLAHIGKKMAANQK